MDIRTSNRNHCYDLRSRILIFGPLAFHLRLYRPDIDRGGGEDLTKNHDQSQRTAAVGDEIVAELGIPIAAHVIPAFPFS